jgi:hypothetical protein
MYAPITANSATIAPGALLWPPDATSPRQCTVITTTQRRLAQALIRAWHSSQPNAPAGERLAFLACAPNSAPVAVALWGRPTARAEDQIHTLQLTRLAHGPGAPPNIGSWFLARMRAYIRREMPQIRRLITYHDAAHHTGAIYAADNWRPVARVQKLHDWTNRPGRSAPGIRDRVKWERTP